MTRNIKEVEIDEEAKKWGIESRPQLDTSDCGHENDKRRQERAIYKTMENNRHDKVGEI